LLNLIKLMRSQIEILEHDFCRQWYAAGRKLFAERAPGAPALHLALAGIVGLSLYSQRSMNTGYMTEVDQAFVEGRFGRGGLSASSVAELNEALDAVEAVLTADHPDEKEHNHGPQI
jgi:hypothetical protein